MMDIDRMMIGIQQKSKTSQIRMRRTKTQLLVFEQHLKHDFFQNLSIYYWFHESPFSVIHNLDNHKSNEFGKVPC